MGLLAASHQKFRRFHQDMSAEQHERRSRSHEQENEQRPQWVEESETHLHQCDEGNDRSQDIKDDCNVSREDSQQDLESCRDAMLRTFDEAESLLYEVLADAAEGAEVVFTYR